LPDDIFQLFSLIVRSSRRRLYFPKLSLHESTQLDELVLPASSLDIFSYDTDLSGISLQTTSMKVSKVN
jgi:hypothetical protein